MYMVAVQPKGKEAFTAYMTQRRIARMVVVQASNYLVSHARTLR